MSQEDQDLNTRPSTTRVRFPLDANSYKIIAEIGAGVSAVVYKALCLPLNSTAVAIKSIDLDQPPRNAAEVAAASSSSDVLENVRREAKILSLLSHPNILNAHCSFTVGRRLWVVMPFMSAGSLQSIIASSFPGGLPEPCIAAVLREILRAVSYLHDQGHLHRDIKAGNILVDADGSVKLADFGVSASIYESNSAHGLGWGPSSTSPLTDVAGTPYWMAPEVIHSHNGYGIKADIWSFGITALELAHGRPPLSHLPLSKSLVMKITTRFRFSDYEKSGDGKSDKSSGKKFSKAFKEMVGLCLKQEPSKRPTAEKLLKHPFFKNCNKGMDFLAKNLLQGLPSVEKRFRVFKNSADHAKMKKKGEDDDDDDDGDEDSKEKRRRISGWNFNEDGFELVPMFPTESQDDSVVKQVRFGGETIIQNKWGESSSGESNPSLPDQTSELAEQSPSAPGQTGESGESLPSELVESDPRSLSEAVEFPESNLSSPDEAGVPEGTGELLTSELGESIPSSPSLGESTPRGGGIDRERVLQDLLSLRRNIEMERTTVTEVLRLMGVEAAIETREEYLERAADKLRSELESERRRNSELELEIEFLKMQINRDE